MIVSNSIDSRLGFDKLALFGKKGPSGIKKTEKKMLKHLQKQKRTQMRKFLFGAQAHKKEDSKKNESGKDNLTTENIS